MNNRIVIEYTDERTMRLYEGIEQLLELADGLCAEATKREEANQKEIRDGIVAAIEALGGSATRDEIEAEMGPELFTQGDKLQNAVTSTATARDLLRAIWAQVRLTIATRHFESEDDD